MGTDHIGETVRAIALDDEFETLSTFEMATVLMMAMKIHRDNLPDQVESVMLQVIASLLRNHADAVGADVCFVRNLFEQCKSNGNKT